MSQQNALYHAYPTDAQHHSIGELKIDRTKVLLVFRQTMGVLILLFLTHIGLAMDLRALRPFMLKPKSIIAIELSSTTSTNQSPSIDLK